MKKDDWKTIFAPFLVQEKIKNFEIAGFSIGAKFVLATLELCTERTEQIGLWATEGITINFVSQELLKINLKKCFSGDNYKTYNRKFLNILNTSLTRMYF